jgi:hypothetical protein
MRALKASLDVIHNRFIQFVVPNPYCGPLRLFSLFYCLPFLSLAGVAIIATPIHPYCLPSDKIRAAKALEDETRRESRIT